MSRKRNGDSPMEQILSLDLILSILFLWVMSGVLWVMSGGDILREDDLLSRALLAILCLLLTVGLGKAVLQAYKRRQLVAFWVGLLGLVLTLLLGIVAGVAPFLL